MNQLTRLNTSMDAFLIINAAILVMTEVSLKKLNDYQTKQLNSMKELCFTFTKNGDLTVSQKSHLIKLIKSLNQGE